MNAVRDAVAAPDPETSPAARHPVLLALAIMVVGASVVLSLPPASLERAVAGQVYWGAMSLVAAVCALWRARREPLAAVGWRLLGLATLVMGLAAISTVIEYLWAGTVLPFPRMGDWLQLSAFAAMGFALLAWPLVSPSPSVRLRTFIDALLFAVAVFATIWATVLWPARTAGVSGAVWGVLVSQFGIMAIIFAIVAYLGLADTSRLRGPLGWMAVTLASAMTGSFLLLAAGAKGGYYVGHPLDLAVSISFLFFARATISPRPVSGAARRGAQLLDPLLFGGWLTYGSVFVAFAVGGWAQIVKRHNDPVLEMLGVGIVMLLMLRQLLAARDIRRLTHGLEAKVAERTRALEESQAAILRTARLEALGRLAGGVAHDINNLLTGILGYAELIEHASPPGDARGEDAQEIRKSVERGARLTRQLLAFARKQPGHAMVLDPLVLAADLEGLLRQLLGRDIALELRRTGGYGRVRIDPGQFEQVIVNLAVNARDAMPEGGRLTIEVADVQVDEAEAARLPGSLAGTFVHMRIADTGHGMTREVLARIFEPFFTTKGEGKGTGLGLATCYGIVNQAGGFVTVQSEPGVGTSFDVHLPLTDAPEEWSPSVEGAGGPLRGTETILLAEDEPAVQEVIAAGLRSQGYTVLLANNGAEAVAAAARCPGPIHLFLTDMMMPEMNGLEAATRIRASRPDLRVLVVSGYMAESAPPGAVAGMRIAYATKPVAPLELTRQVRVLLDLPAVPGSEPTSPPVPPAAL
jgi:signal transduction histidine kinase/CheY-like chemotaxis protein